jgi:hypothetical protein
VILHRQLAVSALDFLVRRRSRDAQHFVIIAFDIRCQLNYLPSSNTTKACQPRQTLCLS